MLALLNIPRIQADTYSTDCEEKWYGKASGHVYANDGQTYYIPIFNWHACVHCPDNDPASNYTQGITGSWWSPVWDTRGNLTGDTVYGSLSGTKVDPDHKDGGIDNVTGQWNVDSTKSGAIPVLDHHGDFSGVWDDLTTTYTQGEVRSGEWHTIPPTTPASGTYDTGTENDGYYGYLYKDCRY